MVHLWLPKAHVEAPVSGSIMLAGTLLKLGRYGLLRVFPVLLKSGFGFDFVWVALRLVGGLFVSLFCIRQTPGI
jgi:NADH-ubiquinone oxidoreductase chain 4